jgi:phage gp45-like
VIEIKAIAAKIRNLFTLSDFQKRYSDDDRIQIKTHNGKVLEKNEAFPYGFYAKAKSGKALVFCQGGNFDNFEILPVLKDAPVFRPKLEDGDAAVYTGEGSYIVLREKGDLEIYTRKEGSIKVNCTGDCIVAVDKNCECKIKGNSTISCDGNTTATISGNSSIAVDGDCACEVKGNYAIKAGTFKVTAERIDLN